MNIQTATEKYETWLGKRIPLIAADLKIKHEQMAAQIYSFLRATYYRWAQVWPGMCPHLQQAPVVLSVGDLHTDNFGTWRDSEGRLTYGVNDFDEVYPLPYTNDLVRLATSAILAVRDEYLSIKPGDACDAILDGYTRALKQGGAPLVLAENQATLRAIAHHRMIDPVRYWQKMDALQGGADDLPDSVFGLLADAMPAPNLSFRVAHRIAGLGSLGHRRYVALADWRGGRIAREAKQLVPSACVWLQDNRAHYDIHYQTLLRRAVRDADPHVHVHAQWLVRRLAPDCSHIELGQLPQENDEEALLRAMGFEAANIHLGSPKAIPDVQHDLAKRPPQWLRKAARDMAAATQTDWDQWREGWREGWRGK